MGLIISGKGNWCSFGKQLGSISKIKIVRPYDQAFSLLGIHCSHLPTLCVQRYVCKDIPRRTVRAEYENYVD